MSDNWEDDRKQNGPCYGDCETVAFIDLLEFSKEHYDCVLEIRGKLKGNCGCSVVVHQTKLGPLFLDADAPYLSEIELCVRGHKSQR